MTPVMFFIFFSVALMTTLFRKEVVSLLGIEVKKSLPVPEVKPIKTVKDETKEDQKLNVKVKKKTFYITYEDAGFDSIPFDANTYEDVVDTFAITFPRIREANISVSDSNHITFYHPVYNSSLYVEESRGFTKDIIPSSYHYDTKEHELIVNVDKYLLNVQDQEVLKELLPVVDNIILIDNIPIYPETKTIIIERYNEMLYFYQKWR